MSKKLVPMSKRLRKAHVARAMRAAEAKRLAALSEDVTKSADVKKETSNA
jgi:hypothetical protein